jgi:hypothetical protein
MILSVTNSSLIFKGMGHFAFSNPDPATGAIGPMFFFPDGSLMFESINGILTGGKGFSTVGTPHCDQYTDLANG